MTDRDAFILACAELAGHTYEQERGLWDARHPEPSPDFSNEVEDRLHARYGDDEHAARVAGDAWERAMERGAA